jgi:hypothetical protein
VIPGLTRLLRASITPFLILLTPFAVFVRHQQYGLARPEVIIIVLAFALLAVLLGAGAAWSTPFEVTTIAALLTLFADIQLDDPGLKRLVLLFLVLGAVLWVLREHAARIVASMLATVLALSLLPRTRAATTTGAAPSQRHDLPLIVHLVLDEYIGLEGLPGDLTSPAFKREMQSFFVDRGFRLFGKAYSEYPGTVPSLSHLLNLTSGSYISGLSTPGTSAGTYRLTRNSYFERLAQQGYVIRAHQSDYLDVCSSRVAASACHTYSATSLRVLERLAVPAREKLSALAHTYLTQSEAVTRLRRGYRRSRQRLLEANIQLPPWNWDLHIGFVPVAAMAALDKVAADLSTSQPGDFLFAHLLIPHYPYVYNGRCQPRPPSEWLMRKEAGEDGPRTEIANSRDGRATRYTLYLEQIVCVQRKLDQLIGAIPPELRRDAIVIVQGDHGSRIGLVDPTGAEASLTVSDYADHFSTLFAVHSPQLQAGYDLRLTPITCLLRTLVESGFRSVAGAGACSSPNVVFFLKGRTGIPVMVIDTPHSLPDFTRAGEADASLAAQ